MTALTWAKERLSISDLWQLRGWPGKPGRSCRVPYRADRNPSGSVLRQGGLFHDFASGENFDAPGLLARVEQLSLSEACQLFIQLAGGISQYPPAAPVHKLPSSHRRRLRLPRLQLPSEGELKRLADLRHVTVEACAAAASRNQLFYADWGGHRCWVITDAERRNAQLRRLDHKNFRRRHGAEIKALTVRGSCASWPVGIANVNEAERLILCEGCGDFLAAYHFALLEQTLGSVVPVVMFGAAQQILPDAIPLLAGKRVRIFPHLDDAGSRAALRWEQQLRDAEIDAHCFDLSGLTRDDGIPVKDLNDLTRIDADDFEANAELRTLTIF